MIWCGQFNGCPRHWSANSRHKCRPSGQSGLHFISLTATICVCVDVGSPLAPECYFSSAETVCCLSKIMMREAVCSSWFDVISYSLMLVTEVNQDYASGRSWGETFCFVLKCPLVRPQREIEKRTCSQMILTFLLGDPNTSGQLSVQVWMQVGDTLRTLWDQMGQTTKREAIGPYSYSSVYVYTNVSGTT